jgi:hypothetical protein
VAVWRAIGLMREPAATAVAADAAARTVGWQQEVLLAALTRGVRGEHKHRAAAVVTRQSKPTPAATGTQGTQRLHALRGAEGPAGSCWACRSPIVLL